MEPRIEREAASVTAKRALGGRKQAKILIAYGTREGQTAKVVGQIASVIQARGVEADAVLIKHGGPDPEKYDAVIVAASIHVGKYEGYVRRFVRMHRDALTRLPSAFVSVSLAAHDETEAGRAEVKGQIEKFVHDTGWRPARIFIVAGALLYTQYDFLTRRIVKKIVRDKGNPDQDTSRDYVYTDWEAVKQFAEEFVDNTVSNLSVEAEPN